MSVDSDFVYPDRVGAFPFGQLFGRSDLNLAASSSVIEGLPDEQRTSPVRRTFLLVTLFDLLFCFVLWIIYVQSISDGDIMKSLQSEVLNYTFRTSLFDTVLLAIGRFLVIEVVYGPFVSRTPWWCAATTGATCGLLVVKCFMFNFHEHTNVVVLVYTVLIGPLILTWIETSFLIYRVIPQEKAAAHVTTHLMLDLPNETHSLLNNLRGSRRVFSTYSTSNAGYHTPVGSLFHVETSAKPTVNREAAVDIAALLHQASMLRSEVWYLYGLDAWGPSLITVGESSVRAASIPPYDNKVYRIETVLEAPAPVVYRDLVCNVDQVTDWNSSIDQIECLQCLSSENVDIVHNTTKEALGGVVCQRDFVLLRHWGEHDERPFLGITSVEHPKCPPMKKCVRAQQPISAFILESILGDANRCKITWIMSVDLKLYLPQRMIDRAIMTELKNSVSSLQSRARNLHCPEGASETKDNLVGSVVIKTPKRRRGFRPKRFTRSGSSTSEESGSNVTSQEDPSLCTEQSRLL